ncbi:MAG: TfoX/Sxy family protein [Ilumatobacteraceae bacterium]
MAFDVILAERVRQVLIEQSDVSERKMFGGLSFMIGDKMAVAASSRGGLLVRVDPATMDSVIATTAAESIDMGTRTMRGWVHVAADAVRTKRDLATWVRRGIEYAESLPDA